VLASAAPGAALDFAAQSAHNHDGNGRDHATDGGGIMRLAAFIVLAVGAGASMLAHAATTGTARVALTPSAAELQFMRHALVDQLRTSEGAIADDLLLSPGDVPGEWQFRGRAAPTPDTAEIGPGQPHPHGALYGRAALTCALDGARAPLAAGCWRVTLLQIGGGNIARLSEPRTATGG
jgi:hypothetical protein